MRFVTDAMFPPQVAERLKAAGHDALTPERLGAHNRPDEALIQVATAEQRVIVTENASASRTSRLARCCSCSSPGGPHRRSCRG
ncbi:MAG: DUF5615 family PIN-like protein, partial [Actinomycetota bacterium]|nr:DUF5615 family PIN-like protein [Actinomycetota bacterium]